MGIVYFELSMSLDGFTTGPNVSDDNLMGDGGEGLHDWMFEGKTGEDSPTFHAPVFVVTNRPHDPIAKDGWTTYHFVTGGLEAAFEWARSAAGDKDIAIVGGADIVRQCLNAGLVDEARLHVIPIVLGGGRRLFDGVDAGDLQFAMTRAVAADGVAHLTLRVG
jgi:dihydrofolate reductase